MQVEFGEGVNDQGIPHYSKSKLSVVFFKNYRNELNKDQDFL